jgi:hypothetical protein
MRFQKHYTLNKNYFNKPNLKNSYWAGLLAADGCIQRKDSVAIVLHKNDEHHLKTFAEYVNYNGPILSSRTDNCVKINFYGAQQWVKDLDKNFSITKKKSLTLKPPPLYSYKLRLAFVIGYLDGDGSIFHRVRKHHTKAKEYQYPCVSMAFVGTLDILEWIKQNLDDLIPPISTINVRKCHKARAYQYVVSGKRAKELVRQLKRIDVPKLERKWR